MATQSLYGVLVAPVQGSEAIRAERRERVGDAVRRALQARGYEVAVSEELLGQAIVACQSPECVEQTLDAAGAELAIVPAIWVQESGGEELTLTLVRREGRNLNASGVVGDDVSGTAAAVVDELLEQRVAAMPAAATPADAKLDAGAKHPHAWKAGPIVLIAGGTAAFVAIGVGAAVKREDQQLNTSAVAAWSAVGAAAIAGGIAWWVVGAKRRRQPERAGPLRAPILTLQPARIDLRLRF